jgi:hypothetical protein
MSLLSHTSPPCSLTLVHGVLFSSPFSPQKLFPKLFPLPKMFSAPTSSYTDLPLPLVFSKGVTSSKKPSTTTQSVTSLCTSTTTSPGK